MKGVLLKYRRVETKQKLRHQYAYDGHRWSVGLELSQGLTLNGHSALL